MIDYREIELLISYYSKRLEELPHGYFGVCNGYAVVYVTYDPANKSCSNNVHRYRLDSPKGRFWAPLIREYEQRKKQLDDLIRQWEITFKFSPRQISFPLKRKRETMFTEEFFDNAKEMATP